VSKLEDDISRVMAGHDGEAPGAADLLRSLERASVPRRRPGWYQALVSALNRLPTRPSTRSCSGSPSPAAGYQLLFSYPEGPPVLVSVLSGCHPAIDDLDLQSGSASSILPVIQQLLKTT
jgi:hypothetical protein